jgi:hypothetical protein
MNAAAEIVERIEAAGGRFAIEGEELVVRPGDPAMPLVAELRLHKVEIIALLQSRIEQETESEPDDLLPGEWLLENCLYLDRWWGGAGALYLDAARWCAARGKPAPESRRAFVAALQTEGFQVGSDGLIAGLVLKVDVEAHEQFQKPPETAYNPNCKLSGHKTGHIARKAKA